MEERLPKGTLGGQAVIEGVMMKGPESYSVAIRRPDKKIEVNLKKYQSYGDKHKICKIPFIRGVANFIESMVVGMKTLTYSSSFYEEDEVETKADKVFKDIFKEKAESVIIGITVVISIVIAVALFMLLPAGIAELIGRWVENHILVSIIEGVIRLVIFILYVLLISQMEDIKRVFMYHGAEHKTINCYESGDDLTPENVAKHSRYHKRCGTSFLFIVMVISIFVFMFITAEQMWLRFVLRLVLIPVVASLSYEFIRLAGRKDNAFFNILSKPGMCVQKITTKEPDEEMIQVAIISVEAVLYGKEYVKAVNEAQGIGAEEQPEADTGQEKEEAEFYEETDLEDVVPDEDDIFEYEEEYDEYEETQKSYKEEYADVYEKEQEAYTEQEESHKEEHNESVKEREPFKKKQKNSKESMLAGKKSMEKVPAEVSGAEETDMAVAGETDNELTEDFDISDFEKSFFED